MGEAEERARSPLSGDPIRAAVVEVICEVTGYPPDLVAEGADLEADLGVDSIRKMEILGTLEKRLGFASRDADYAILAQADIETLVAHVRRRLEPQAAPEADAPSPAPQDAILAVPARRALSDAPERGPAPPRVVWIPARADPADVVRQLTDDPLTGSDPVAAVLPDDPGGAAAAGWLRSAARELGRPLRLLHTVGVVCRERVSAELASVRPAETWLDADGAWTETLVPAAPAAEAVWPADPVILATGGVRGILVSCLRALADRRPRVLVVGRTIPEAPDVAGALASLRAGGIEAEYHQADVTREAEVRAAADAARARWGRIDVVLHAAGILRDGPLGRVPADDLAAVLAVKWDGARHLVDATRADRLTWFCTFSSLVARFGNPAQAGYAAANAAMAAVTHPTAARTTHVLWTAWSEVGMAADPRLLALLGARGVASIRPEVGGAVFRRIADALGSGPVLVTSGGSEPGTLVAPLRWPLGGPDRLDTPPLSFAIPLDPDSPPLSDHRVGGRPLVPAALWLAALLEAARAASGRDGPFAVEAMAIAAPVFVDRPRRDVRLRLERDGDGWQAVIEAGGGAVCRARIAASPPPAPNGGPPRPLVDPEPARALYRPDLLFHGPAWQVLRNLRTDAAGAQADLRHVGREVLASGPSAVASVVDGAHQVLAAWSGRAAGWLGLPVGADRWVADGPLDRVVRIETLASTGGQELTADVVALDPDGRVVIRGEGVRLRAARFGRGPDADA